MLPCKETSFGAKVCLVAVNKPLIGDGDPRRLPVLAVKVSTGKAVEKGIEHYLTAPWKEGWEDWLKQAKEAFPSVLEHITLTFHIDGCSRVCSHQLVRHRLVSFTQESQRYTEARILKAVKADSVKSAKAKYQKLLNQPNINMLEKVLVIPPKIKGETVSMFVKEAIKAVLSYLELRLKGVPMEDARFLLPQAVKTSLLATANLREWLHIIELRAHPKAQWEIREVAICIGDLIEKILHYDLGPAPH